MCDAQHRALGISASGGGGSRGTPTRGGSLCGTRNVLSPRPRRCPSITICKVINSPWQPRDYGRWLEIKARVTLILGGLQSREVQGEPCWVHRFWCLFASRCTLAFCCILLGVRLTGGARFFDAHVKAGARFWVHDFGCTFASGCTILDAYLQVGAQVLVHTAGGCAPTSRSPPRSSSAR